LETNNTEEQSATEATTEETTLNDPKAVLAALDRAKSDAKKFREEKEKLEVDLNSSNQKIAEFSGKLLHEKVLQKISAEGVKEPRRLLKFMDLTKFEFDDDLNVVGFEDQFKQLQEDLPEIFDPKLRVGGQADTAVKASVSTQYSATQLQAAKILGKL
jgi:hypothetical protein